MALKFSFHVAVDRLCIEAQPLTTVSRENLPDSRKATIQKIASSTFLSLRQTSPRGSPRAAESRPQIDSPLNEKSQ
jgi:hypothetical protein